MKILVISDSHGKKERVEEVLKRETYDYFIFLGDGLSDIKSVIDDPKTVAVKGNCDFFSSLDDTKIVEMAGLRFLLTHGDRYHVKSTLYPLSIEAKQLGVDVVLYGHTHSFSDQTYDDIRYINCPSLYKSFDGKTQYLRLSVDDKKISNRVVDF